MKNNETTIFAALKAHITTANKGVPYVDELMDEMGELGFTFHAGLDELRAMLTASAEAVCNRHPSDVHITDVLASVDAIIAELASDPT